MDDCGLQGVHPEGAQCWKPGAYHPRTDPVSPWGRGKKGGLGEGAPDGGGRSGTRRSSCSGRREPSLAVPSELVSSCALPISPGLRGMVVVADKTAELYKTTYWASYNIPYVLFLFPHSPHPQSVFPEAESSPVTFETCRTMRGSCTSCVTSSSGSRCRVTWDGHTLGLGIARHSAGPNPVS